MAKTAKTAKRSKNGLQLMSLIAPTILELVQTLTKNIVFSSF